MSYPDDNVAWQNRFAMNADFEWVLGEPTDDALRAALQAGESR